MNDSDFPVAACLHGDGLACLAEAFPSSTFGHHDAGDGDCWIEWIEGPSLSLIRRECDRMPANVSMERLYEPETVIRHLVKGGSWSSLATTDFVPGAEIAVLVPELIAAALEIFELSNGSGARRLEDLTWSLDTAIAEARNQLSLR